MKRSWNHVIWLGNFNGLVQWLHAISCMLKPWNRAFVGHFRNALDPRVEPRVHSINVQLLWGLE